MMFQCSHEGKTRVEATNTGRVIGVCLECGSIWTVWGAFDEFCSVVGKAGEPGSVTHRWTEEPSPFTAEETLKAYLALDRELWFLGMGPDERDEFFRWLARKQAAREVDPSIAKQLGTAGILVDRMNLERSRR